MPLSMCSVLFPQGERGLSVWLPGQGGPYAAPWDFRLCLLQQQRFMLKVRATAWDVPEASWPGCCKQCPVTVRRRRAQPPGSSSGAPLGPPATSSCPAGIPGWPRCGLGWRMGAPLRVVDAGRGFHALLGLRPMILGAALGAGHKRSGQHSPGRHAALWRGIPRTVAIAVGLALVALAAVIARPASTAPAAGPDGKPLAGGIAELSSVRTGGKDLGLMLRGTGTSYPDLDPTSTHSLEGYVGDTLAVTNHLRERVWPGPHMSHGPVRRNHSRRHCRTAGPGTVPRVHGHLRGPVPQLQDTDFRTTAVSLDVPVFFVQGAHEARGRVEPFRECAWFWLCPA